MIDDEGLVSSTSNIIIYNFVELGFSTDLISKKCFCMCTYNSSSEGVYPPDY